MPAAEIAFIAKVREQIEFLQHEEYNYDQLRVYVSGIARPWVFGPADEFEFDGDEVLCRLAVYALVLGTGKKLFSDGFALARLTLVETRALRSGVLVNTYRRSDAAERDRPRQPGRGSR